MAEKALKYQIMENGIDSIEHGIEHFISGETNKRNYKFAVLHIFHGIEMILKEKLFRVNPVLIYKNIDQGINDQSHTVAFGKLSIRLKNVGVKLSKDDINTICEIQQVRNQIEHKDVSLNINDAKNVIGRIMKFLITFMRTELGQELKSFIEQDKYKILLDSIDFYEEKLRLAEAKVKEHFRGGKDDLFIEVLFCPWCFKETVVNEPDENGLVKCYFCDEEYYVDECARCGTTVLLQEKDDEPAFCDSCESWLENS